MPCRRPLPRTTLAVAVLLITAVPSCGPDRVALPSVETGLSTPAADDPIEAMARSLTEAIDRVRGSAVALEYTAADAPSHARRVASGVVISPDGEVLSVRIDAPPAASPITARVASGRRLPASWVASDPETGLTLLRIDPGAARPAVPAPGKARLGVPVLVIGNPFGLAHSVSRGFVAGLDRRLELGARQLGGLIQIDASLHPGDSGALLADLRGDWLGVIRSGLAAPGEGDRRGRELDHDLGFAIPAGDALWVASQLRTRKRVDRAYLGVTMDHNAPAPAGGVEGAVLGRVLADTPAERAGLKAGDRVVAIDGEPVRSPYDLTDRLDRTPADADVTLDLLDGPTPGQGIRQLIIRTARRPPYEPPRPSSPSKGRTDEARPAPSREALERLEKRVQELEKREAGESQSRRK